MLSTLAFIVFPYVAVVLAVGVGVYRYFARRFTYSSLSSQLLENRKLYWGSVPWHYGITIILLVHFFAWLLPGTAAWVLGNPLRLLIIELIGLALSFYTAFGLTVLVIRRLPMQSRPRMVSSAMDWIVLLFLAVQMFTGIGIALYERWGSLWFLSTAVPWLWSLILFHPDASTVANLPGLIQAHFLSGFALVLLFPFSRLVHIFSVPLDYLWRPYQVVVWYRDPRLVHPPVAVPARVTLPDVDAGADPPGDPPGDDPPGDPPDRRSALSRLGIVLGAIASGIIAVPSIGFLLGLRRAPSVWRSLGKVTDFAVGQTVEVAFLDPSPLPWAGVTAKTAAWLRRESDSHFTAFAINCTHLGCPVRWLPNADLFMCPCHGGVFYADGRVASGPPPRPLTHYPVRVRDGVVEILASPLPITSV